MYVEFEFKSTFSHYIGVDLKEVGEEDETLIVVTAGHGHGLVCCCPVTSRAYIVQDVFGGADTKYLASQDTDRANRRAGECSLTRQLIRG